MDALPSLFFRSSSQRRRVYELLRIRELESLQGGGRSVEESEVIIEGVTLVTGFNQIDSCTQRLIPSAGILMALTVPVLFLFTCFILIW